MGSITRSVGQALKRSAISARIMQKFSNNKQGSGKLKETLKSTIKHLESYISNLRKITALKTFLTQIGSKRLSQRKKRESNSQQVSRLDQSMLIKSLRGNTLKLTINIQCFAWRHCLRISKRKSGTTQFKLVTLG